VDVVGVEIDHEALMDVWSRRSRYGSKCFANITGISGTISHYLPRSNRSIVRGAFYSKSSSRILLPTCHTPWHSRRIWQFCSIKISDNFLPPLLIQGRISAIALRIAGDSERVLIDYVIHSPICSSF
jgi:hypothetical protein